MLAALSRSTCLKPPCANLSRPSTPPRLLHPHTLVLLDLSFSIRPRPCFAPHRPTTATDPPSRTGGFSSSNTSFDFYRLFSLQVYTLLLFQRLPLPLLRYSTNRDLRVRPKARRLRASHRRVSLYKGKVKVLREKIGCEEREREEWLDGKEEIEGRRGARSIVPATIGLIIT